MEPIISPWLVYFISISTSIKAVFATITIISLGIATVIAFILALIGLFGVEMSTAINLLMLTVGSGLLLLGIMFIIKVLALK